MASDQLSQDPKGTRMASEASFGARLPSLDLRASFSRFPLEMLSDSQLSEAVQGFNWRELVSNEWVKVELNEAATEIVAVRIAAHTDPDTGDGYQELIKLESPVPMAGVPALDVVVATREAFVKTFKARLKEALLKFPLWQITLKRSPTMVADGEEEKGTESTSTEAPAKASFIAKAALTEGR